MEPRKVFHNREYRLPRTSFTLSGYSRAAYRSGFYINGLGIALDAGPQFFKRVSHYLITHGHTDHTACLPYSLIGDSEVETADGKVDKPIVYCPEEISTLLDDKILASFRSNYGTDKMDSRIRSFYEVQGLEASAVFRIVANKQPLTIRTYQSDHSVATLVYGISMEKKKLKPEYVGLSKDELRDLVKGGTQLSGPVDEPMISYVLDSSIHTLEDNPELLDYPTVIIECTFLFDGEEEDAEDKKHIHWKALLPYIVFRPDTTFILTHFSLKYTDEEIQDFFREQIVENELNNVVPWLTDIEFTLEDHEENEDILEEYEDSVVSLSTKSNMIKDLGKTVICYSIFTTCLYGTYALWF
jgi:ribonuclease Z